MSRTWRSFSDLNSELSTGSRIQYIMSTANFDYLVHQALQARATSASDLKANVDRTHFAAGSNNLVLKLIFSDDITWILRIPLHEGQDTSTDMLSEITTMRLVRQRTSIPVAKVFAFEVTPGAFGFPFVLMEYLAGTTTSLGLARAVPVEHRPKVAQQIARVLYELSQITFGTIGRLIAMTEDDPISIIGNNWHAVKKPMKSSLEFFYGQRYKENSEVRRKHGEDTQWNTACWVLANALSHVVIPDRINGPFPLCHLDLYFGNFLFDEEFNLTGIIDWSNAQTAPFEQLIVLPDFMVHISPANREAVQGFKSLIIEALAKLENSTLPGPKLSDSLASIGSEVYTCIYMNEAHNALDTAKTVAKLIYKDTMTCEQLVAVYGSLPAPRLFCVDAHDSVD